MNLIHWLSLCVTLWSHYTYCASTIKIATALCFIIDAVSLTASSASGNSVIKRHNLVNSIQKSSGVLDWMKDILDFYNKIRTIKSFLWDVIRLYGRTLESMLLLLNAAWDYAVQVLLMVKLYLSVLLIPLQLVLVGITKRKIGDTVWMVTNKIISLNWFRKILLSPAVPTISVKVKLSHILGIMWFAVTLLLVMSSMPTGTQ